MSFWILRRGNLGTPIKVATPRKIDWQAGIRILIKSFFTSAEGWELAGNGLHMRGANSLEELCAGCREK